MVRKVRFVMMVFAILLAVSTCLTYGASPNLIKNPGFEEVSGTLPAEWTYKDGDLPQGVTYGISKNAPRSGSNSLVITNTEEFDTIIAQKLKVQQDKVYRISCWIRAENIANQPGSANITLYYVDNGFGCKGIYTSRELSNTGNQWQLLEFYIKTLKISDPLSIGVRLGGQGTKNRGTAYFDDLTVELVQNPGSNLQIEQFFVPGKQQDTGNQTGNPGSPKSNPIIIYVILGLLGLGLLAYFEIKLTKKEKKENDSVEDKDEEEAAD